MLVRKFSIAVAAVALITAAVAFAQTTPAPSAAMPDGGVPAFVRAETAEQRQARVGSAEDPGLDPDPNKHYWRFGKSYHIQKYERRLAAYDTGDANYVRPLGMVNFAFEIYQQNEKWVWVWIEDIDEVKFKETVDATAVEHSRYSKDDMAYFARIRPQFAELTPADSGKRITFAESSEGLPNTGSWRNSLAVADMNEDKCPDIVTPPERKGAGVPHIFLGDCKGHWREWANVKWPHGLDYGGVTAADLNKDGHVDLAFGVHLNGIYVFLGDGKGGFIESTEGLPRDFPTRRVAVTDVDGDGYPDLVGTIEGPTGLEGADHSPYGFIRAYLNRKKGMAWEGVNVVDPGVKIGGDWISVGRFSGARYPDIIASSVFFGATQVAHVSDGPKKWKTVATDGDVVPAWSYYFGSASGKFTRGGKEDPIISYVRYWPSDVDARQVATPPVVELSNVDRLVFTKDGLKRIPIMRWSGHAGSRGVATGDFDGDGNLDVIFTREDLGQREAVILLGDGKGNFTRAPVDGLTLEDNSIYDIKVADVNGDSKPDVVLMYETYEQRREDFYRFTTKNLQGSVKVFLNHGAKKTSSQPMKAAK